MQTAMAKELTHIVVFGKRRVTVTAAQMSALAELRVLAAGVRALAAQDKPVDVAKRASNAKPRVKRTKGAAGPKHKATGDAV
jgi:hypothetical protein